MSAAVDLFGRRARDAAPVLLTASDATEVRADHLMPRDRLRRGHRLFEVRRVLVSTDQVVAVAQLLAAAGGAGAEQELTFPPAEICRLDRRTS